MKLKFISTFSAILFSVNAMAYGSIVISTEGAGNVEIQWLGSEADESEIELAWRFGGQDAVFNGDVCFKGARKDAIQVLDYLDSVDFMGDELSIQDVHYVGKDRISYEIYDGPNEWVADELIIFACK